LDLDGQRVDDVNYEVPVSEKKEHILKIGKKRFYKFRVR
jgi:hypothetical protein